MEWVLPAVVAVYLGLGLVLGFLLSRRAGWGFNHWLTCIVAGPLVLMSVFAEEVARRWSRTFRRATK